MAFGRPKVMRISLLLGLSQILASASLGQTDQPEPSCGQIAVWNVLESAGIKKDPQEVFQNFPSVNGVTSLAAVFKQMLHYGITCELKKESQLAAWKPARTAVLCLDPNSLFFQARGAVVPLHFTHAQFDWTAKMVILRDSVNPLNQRKLPISVLQETFTGMGIVVH